MKRIVRLVVVIASLWLPNIGWAQVSAGPPRDPVRDASGKGIANGMVEHVIASDLAGAYQVLAVDMNTDKRPDLIVLSTTGSELFWFENPSWQRHTIATGLSNMVYMDAADLDGDGIPEIALAHGFANAPASEKFPGNISILMNQGDPGEMWSIKEIDRVPRSHRIKFVDAEGDGKKVVVVAPIAASTAVGPDFLGRVPIFYYRPGEWKRLTVTDAEEGEVHGIEVASWDGGYPRQAFLNSSFLGITLNRLVNGRWERETLTDGDPSPWPKSGSSDVVLGTLFGGRFMAAIEPFHGNQIVLYFQAVAGIVNSSGSSPASLSWSRQVIDDTLQNAHTIVAADLDGDGVDEIIAGVRGGSKQVFLYQLQLSAPTRTAQWTRQLLDSSAPSPATCVAADLNSDGRVDVVCTGDSATLKWYENQIPRTRSSRP